MQLCYLNNATPNPHPFLNISKHKDKHQIFLCFCDSWSSPRYKTCPLTHLIPSIFSLSLPHSYLCLSHVKPAGHPQIKHNAVTVRHLTSQEEAARQSTDSRIHQPALSCVHVLQNTSSDTVCEAACVSVFTALQCDLMLSLSGSCSALSLV